MISNVLYRYMARILEDPCLYNGDSYPVNDAVPAIADSIIKAWLLYSNPKYVSNHMCLVYLFIPVCTNMCMPFVVNVLQYQLIAWHSIASEAQA